MTIYTKVHEPTVTVSDLKVHEPTVSELIEKLQEMPKDYKVIIDSSDGEYSPCHIKFITIEKHGDESYVNLNVGYPQDAFELESAG